ncbi:unnamed protein product [Polarella glacialis]|uniref:Uncharacterized protein n=1 Tax=Polarella glacialis TaxID=89957 RepID=A0A813FRC7_POLGL|nr:unnamed protein product [Polarella glacialis]
MPLNISVAMNRIDYKDSLEFSPISKLNLAQLSACFCLIVGSVWSTGRPLHLRVDSVALWSLPEADEIEFDYVSSYRPPEGSKPLSDNLWESLMIEMYDSQCRQEDKLKVLRDISPHIFLSAMHMRQMIGYFRRPEDRQETFVILYLRIQDMQNAKVFLCRFGKEAEACSSIVNFHNAADADGPCLLLGAKELAQLRQDLVRGLKGLKASIVEEDQRLETSEEKLAAQRSEPDPEPALSKCAKPWSKKAHRGAQLNSMIHLYANPPAQDAKDAKGGVEERRDDNNDEKKHEKKDEIKDMKDGEKKDAKKGEKNDDENKEKKGEKKDEEKKEKQGEKKGEEKQCEKGEKQGEKIAEKKEKGEKKDETTAEKKDEKKDGTKDEKKAEPQTDKQEKVDSKHSEENNNDKKADSESKDAAQDGIGKEAAQKSAADQQTATALFRIAAFLALSTVVFLLSALFRPLNTAHGALDPLLRLQRYQMLVIDIEMMA